MRVFSWMAHLLSWIKRLITGEYRQNRKFTPRMRRNLQESFVFLPETGRVSELTYTAAIEYFLIDRPNDERIVMGAILRQRPLKQDGLRLVQVFLDKDLNLVYGHDGKPYGRKMVVSRLNRELRDAFGGTDLIIVE
jgi:hypothetical protein